MRFSRLLQEVGATENGKGGAELYSGGCRGGFREGGRNAFPGFGEDHQKGVAVGFVGLALSQGREAFEPFRGEGHILKAHFPIFAL